ncbi:MAG: hypothetical protein ACRDPQ_22630 [Nocardioidaceae bacterium]
MTTRDKNPTLQRLDALVGEWRVRIDAGGTSLDGGRMVCTWLAGEGILHQWAEAEPDDSWPQVWVDNSPLPTSVAIGLDDRTQELYYVYSDARGVCRVYRMSFADGVWQIWGQSGADFHQRFVGRLSSDGNAIEAYWDHSPDGESWERDFDLTYTKVT